MVNWPRAALAFFCLLPPATAQITGFTLNPPDPVMGELVTYTAVTQGNNQPVASFSWEYRYISGPCNLPWTQAQFGFLEFWMSPEPRPGTWEVRLTVTYQSPGQDPVSGMMLPPPPPTVITNNVTVAPATRVTIVDGNGNQSAPSGSVTLRYRIEAPNRPCGPFLWFGLAQESSPSWSMLVPPFSPPGFTTFDWLPNEPSPQFYREWNEIVDIQFQNFSVPFWEQIPTGVIYSSMLQQLRLRYADPCGNIQYIVLSSTTVNRRKVSWAEWQLEATVNP